MTDDPCADGRCTRDNCAEEKDDRFREKQAEALGTPRYTPKLATTIGAKNTIGYLACSLISQGLSTRAVLDEVFRQFPNGADGAGFRTTDKCIAWYRHDMKKHAAKYAELSLVHRPAR
jgi:hypothetical protein